MESQQGEAEWGCNCSNLKGIWGSAATVGLPIHRSQRSHLWNGHYANPELIRWNSARLPHAKCSLRAGLSPPAVTHELGIISAACRESQGLVPCHLLAGDPVHTMQPTPYRPPGPAASPQLVLSPSLLP